MKTKIIRDPGHKISMQLYEILKEDILQNHWKENSKFYSIRQVSIKFEVNLNTVLKVFQTLEEEGYLYSIKGKGCFIKKGHHLDVNERMTPILNTFRFGQNTREQEINFSNGAPPKEYFPIEAYKTILAEILTDVEGSKNLLGYQNIQGLESLRQELARFVKQYGIFVSKDNIIICSGTQNALQLISTSLGTLPRKTVLLSNPTYQNAVHILESSCNIENIDLQSDGWDMRSLEEILQSKKIHLVYVMTNFQNPTGISWSIAKKKKLLEFASKYDFYIIEDDCFADFYYEKKRTKPMKALDKEGRVLYLKTFSKVVMPGIGLAMLIPPKNFVEKCSIHKYFIDTTTSGIHQKFLELFLKRGLLEQHLDQLREILGKRMKYMVEILQKIPHLRILHIPKGGFFLWIELANYIDGEKFYYKCRLRGLSILPGFIFYSDKKNSCKIRISIVSSSFEEMKAGFQIIQDILEHCEGVNNEIRLP
ncbi:Transcriptional regulator, GntR family [Fusobacterium necrophorum subsp. funduliforme]|uniref:aminotransferase-like domain-containing protein n=1 Tax=Fusobacterium necrophorum TaxID=859 RepID=UPI00370F64B4